MEVSPYRGLSELGMDDFSFIHQWMNTIDEHSAIPKAAAFAENLQQSLSHPTVNLKTSRETSQVVGVDRPVKQVKTNSWGSCITDPVSTPQAISSPNILSFDHNSNYMNQIGILKPKEEPVSSNYPIMLPTHFLKPQGSFENKINVFKACQGGKKVSTSTRSSQTQDHIIAERKRREKLSQRFIALSAIVPGLKKTDKASVLGDAIKYLKQLQEQVKNLEEQTRERTVESMVFVKKTQLFADGDNSSIGEDFSENPFEEPLPEIEARFLDKNVLVRIHCERKKGVVEKIVADIEKLHLTVINSSVLTFGTSALDVTIIAQMDTDFCMTVKDIVKVIRSALQKII